MLSISETALFQKSLAALPLVTYQDGETPITAASTIGRLLNLKEDAVEVVTEDAGGPILSTPAIHMTRSLPTRRRTERP